MYTSRPTGGRKNCKSIRPSLNEKDYKAKTETDLVSVSPKHWFKFVFLLLKKKKELEIQHETWLCSNSLNILISEVPKR